MFVLASESKVRRSVKHSLEHRRQEGPVPPLGTGLFVGYRRDKNPTGLVASHCLICDDREVLRKINYVRWTEMTTRLKRTVGLASICTAAAFGTALAIPGAASALPGNCSYTILASSKSVQAVCPSGTGEFRATAVCRDAERGITNYRYGIWTPAGTTSSFAYCQGSELATDAGVTLRN